MRYISFSILPVLVLLAGAPAQASCVSVPGYFSCFDDSGNEYAVQSLPGMTMTKSYNAATGQSQTSSSMNIGGGGAVVIPNPNVFPPTVVPYRQGFSTFGTPGPGAVAPGEGNPYSYACGPGGCGWR